MSPDRLIYMVNQIGRFFAHQPREQAAEAIADHLRKFWDPRMRIAIRQHLAQGGAGLDPLSREAVARLDQAPELIGAAKQD